MRLLFQCFAATVVGFAVAAVLSGIGADDRGESAGKNGIPPVDSTSLGLSLSTPETAEASADSASAAPAELGSSAKGNALALLADADESLEFFSSAAKFMQGVGALTRADVASVLSDAALPAGVRPHLFSRYGRLLDEALMDRCFQLDPEKTMEILRRNDLEHLFLAGAFARRHPTEVIRAWMQDQTIDRRLLNHAFYGLGAREPEAGGRLLASFPEDGRTELKSAMATGLAERDPIAAIELGRKEKDRGVLRAALESAERIGPGVLRRVVEASLPDFETAPELADLALRFPSLFDGVNLPVSKGGGKPTRASLASARQMTPAERAEVLAAPEKIPAALRATVISSVVQTWAKNDPAGAVKWAWTYAAAGPETGDAAHLLGTPFADWHLREPEAAVNWWQGLSDCVRKRAIGTVMLKNLSERYAWKEARGFLPPAADGEIAAGLRDLVVGAAGEDPQEAGEWLQSLSPTAYQQWVMDDVITAFYRRDREMAGQWVKSLPAGVARDRAIEATVKLAAWREPSSAAAWIQLLDSAATRRVAGEVYQQLQERDPSSGATWLRSLPNLDPEWRDRFIRLAR